MTYFQEDAPMKEIEIIPQVGDLNLWDDLNVPETF
jgi:hypothetical protein